VIVDSDDSDGDDSRPGPSIKRHWAAEERKVKVLCIDICTSAKVAKCHCTWRVSCSQVAAEVHRLLRGTRHP
jgi:hypothetical protein